MVKAAQSVRSSEKTKALQAAFSQIDKQFGKGSVMLMGEKAHVKIDSISTGSLRIDDALGVGGLPRGRIVEIYGPESSGKTTLALHFVSEIQRRNEIAAYVDAEHALDLQYARNLGVDIQNLIIVQPDYGEQALDIVDILINSGTVDVIVIDSVASLIPKSELAGEIGDHSVGAQARMMSQCMRKITGATSRNKVLVFFINQIRMKIGVMFGSPETTSGGNALKFYASIRCDVRRIGTKIEDGEKVANETRVKCVKNKVATPYREAEFIIQFGTGVDKNRDLIKMAVKNNIVDKSGAWYSYGNTRIGQGEKTAASFLEENDNIRKEIIMQLKSPTVGDAIKNGN